MENMPKIEASSIDSSRMPLPIYEVVKRQITEAIMSGEWAAGAVLPSEIALAQLYGVAVGTVRRAFTDLTAEGLVTRRRKTGTIVTGRAPQHSIRFFFQYFRLHGADGSLVTSTSVPLSLYAGTATEREASLLEMEPGVGVVRLHRLRLIDDTPVMHETIILPSARVPGFPEVPQQAPPALFLYLQVNHGIKVSTVRDQVRANLATEQDAQLLQLSLPNAVLCIDEVAFDQSAKPILVSYGRATTSQHMYVNEIK